MAIMETILCSSCRQERHVVCSAGELPTICNKCEEKEREAEKRAHLDALATLTTEERLARVEKELYDLTRRESTQARSDVVYGTAQFI